MAQPRRIMEATVLCVIMLIITIDCSVASTISVGTMRTGVVAIAGEHAYGQDPAHVELSWTLAAGAASTRGAVQTTYSIEVADGANGATIIWKSGVVASTAQQATIPAATLSPAHTYSWRVAVGASSDEPPLWSSWLPFDTALAQGAFDAAGAEWVGAANATHTSGVAGNQLRMRNGLALPEGVTVTRARAYVSGVGAFYLFLNGQQVGDHRLDPQQSNYKERIAYETFDITSMIQSGGEPNVFGAALGMYKWGYLDVWCNMTARGGPPGCRALILLVVVHTSDGATHTAVSRADDWVLRSGPVVYDHLFHGEIYDARLELDRWCTGSASSFPAGTWAAAVRMDTSTLVGPLVPASTRPIRPWRSLPPVNITEIDNTCSDDVVGGTVEEGSVLTLACAEGTGTISSIEFASFGLPSGSCPHFAINSSCHAQTSASVVAAACVGKSSCSVPATLIQFGTDPCPNLHKQLSVVARGCSAPGSSYVVDFGQNMNGVASIQLQNMTSGSSVVMRFGELVHQDGTVYNSYWPGSEPDGSCLQWGGNCANQTDVYIAKGSASTETYTPWFTSHGFRYVQLYGLTEVPDEQALVGYFLSSDLRDVGRVQFPTTPGTPLGTDDVLNGIQGLASLAQRSQAFGGIVTDCPQRERRGWLGDAHMSSNEAALNYDMQAQHRAFVRNIRDDQLLGCANNTHSPCANPEAQVGSFGDVSPWTSTPYGNNPGSPVWMSAYPVIVRHLYRNYADLSALEQHYQGLLDLMGYFERNVDKATGLLLEGGLGDWVPPPSNESTPTPLVTSFYWIYDMQCVALVAGALGKSADAASWSTKASHATALWHAAWWNATIGSYAQGSQTANVLALELGAPPTQLMHNQTAAALLASIRDHGMHTTSGIVGMTFAFDVLRRIGAGETGLNMLLRDDMPSFGYMRHEGATTMWENWLGDRYTPVGSRNHVMFAGGVGVWAYTALVGIDTVVNTSTAGWQHVSVRPLPAAVARLGSAAGSVATRFGNVTCMWRWSAAGGLSLNTTLPVGTSGSVSLPVLGDSSKVLVLESGKAVWAHGVYVAGVPGIVSGSADTEDGSPVIRFEVGSGSFKFSVMD